MHYASDSLYIKFEASDNANIKNRGINRDCTTTLLKVKKR